jgi:transposase
MAKKYIVDLSKYEKQLLVELTSKGKPGARKIKRANILLLAHDGKTDLEIAELLHTGLRTVERVRQKFVLGGLDFALNERSRAGRLPKINDKVETILTTLAQSKPPAGRVRWTLQLLADRLVALTHLESLSYEAVRLVLKKTISNPGSVKNGAFQPWSGPDLSGAWKTFSICMRNLSNQSTPSFVLMRSLINWLARPANLCRFKLANQYAMITSISAKELVICSCFCSPWLVGDM